MSRCLPYLEHSVFTVRCAIPVRIRPNSTVLSSPLADRRPAREPARELNSVMEFGLYLHVHVTAGGIPRFCIGCIGVSEV